MKKSKSIGPKGPTDESIRRAVEGHSRHFVISMKLAKRKKKAK